MKLLSNSLNFFSISHTHLFPKGTSCKLRILDNASDKKTKSATFAKSAMFRSSFLLVKSPAGNESFEHNTISMN